MAKRINVIVPDDLIDQVDAAAKAMSLSRSSWMVQAAAQAVTAQNMRTLLVDMSEALRRIGTAGNDDNETVQKLSLMLDMMKPQE